MKIKKKNPHLYDIEKYIGENSSKFKYLNSGTEGDVYYFESYKSLIVNTEILKSGKYVLKIFSYDLGPKQINEFIKLSKYGVIPKIYVITKRYIIMKYIAGDLYYYFKKEHPEKLKLINNKIEDLLEIWDKLDLSHGDLSEGNIIIGKNNSVYFIDPRLTDTGVVYKPKNKL